MCPVRGNLLAEPLPRQVGQRVGCDVVRGEPGRATVHRVSPPVDRPSGRERRRRSSRAMRSAPLERSPRIGPTARSSARRAASRRRRAPSAPCGPDARGQHRDVDRPVPRFPPIGGPRDLPVRDGQRGRRSRRGKPAPLDRQPGRPGRPGHDRPVSHLQAYARVLSSVCVPSQRQWNRGADRGGGRRDGRRAPLRAARVRAEGPPPRAASSSRAWWVGEPQSGSGYPGRLPAR